VRTAAGNIQIATRVHNVEGYAAAAQILSGADVVFFLGFGYNLDLLSRIGVKHIRAGIPVHGTSMGVRELHRTRVTSLLAQNGAKVDLDRAANRRDIGRYLQDYEDLIKISSEN